MPAKIEHECVFYEEQEENTDREPQRELTITKILDFYSDLIDDSLFEEI